MKKYALVTGATSGIGKEISLLLAAAGYQLVIVARSRKNLKEFADTISKRFNIEVLPIAIDLSQTLAAQDVFDQVQKHHLSIEVLINSAGFGSAGKFWEIDKAKEASELQLNIITLTLLTKLFLPQMIEKKMGKILNVASVAAFFPGPFMSVYFASKAYVLSFSLGLAEELRGTGVSVTTLCPPPTESNFAEAAGVKETQSFSGKLLTSAQVAKNGFNGMMLEKNIVFCNMSSRILVLATKFLPSTVVTKLVRLSTQL